MSRRALTLILVSLVLAPTVADATPIRGRSVKAQASVAAATASVFGVIDDRVQVLASLCNRPSDLRRCVPMPERFQRAFAEALGARVLWVDERRVPGPDLLVFAPVEMGTNLASAEVAWWERGTHGCFGNARTEFTRRLGAWVESGGQAWAACPAPG